MSRKMERGKQQRSDHISILITAKRSIGFKIGLYFFGVGKSLFYFNRTLLLSPSALFLSLSLLLP